jgi:hypothetical protein
VNERGLLLVATKWVCSEVGLDRERGKGFIDIGDTVSASVRESARKLKESDLGPKFTGKFSPPSETAKFTRVN